MKVRKLFENWDMTGLKIKAGFLESEWRPQVKDCEAAWELYIELLTRTATQPIAVEDGTEASALESVYSIFGSTRSILRNYGRDALEFAKVAIIVLNQVIRPFTARWHKLSTEGAFQLEERKAQFRRELAELQIVLRNYMGMLSEIAGVEDISAVVEIQTD